MMSQGLPYGGPPPQLNHAGPVQQERKASTSSKHAHDDQDGDDQKPKRTRISAACAFCRGRKARCDGGNPCSHCRSNNQPCVYPPKSRKVDAEYIAELETKARYLEDMQTRMMPTPVAPQSYPPPHPQLEPQFARGPLPLPSQAAFRAQHPFSPASASHYAVSPAASPANSNGGLGALADAAAAEHEAVPAHFANKQSPSILPVSIAEVPPEADGQSSRPTTRDGRNREGLALIAHEYPGTSSTSALAGRVQNAVTHLMGGATPQASRPGSSGGPAQPYRGQNNRFIFQHSAAPEDLYVLPHRPLADQLLTIYRDHLHTILPIFHWPTFEAQYFQLWGSDAIDTDLLGKLNLIFANASLIAPEGVLPAGKAYESSMRFYKRALKIMYPLVLASESIAGLQCLILMTHYLQFTPEAQLCWTTCGNCVRVAQCRGFHVSSTTENLDPIEREVRRRIWGACVQLDSSICVTLGFPSSLSAAECISVEPLLADDVFISAAGSNQPPDQPSTLAFFSQSNRLAAIQVETVGKLYTSKDISTSKMPDLQAVMVLDRSLAEWQTKVPAHLTLSRAGVQARGGRRQLETQATVLTSRALALKMHIHRPLLFHLCARGQAESNAASAPARPSPLDERLAKASAQLCAEAAIELLEQCLDGWKHTDVRLWAMQLYYAHSAALVVLAARIVDENEEQRGGLPKFKLVDAAQTDVLLTRVLDFFAQLAGEMGSTDVPAAVSSGPARKTARRCRAMLSKISEALNIVAAGRKGGVSPGSSAPSHFGGAEDRYEDYARAFLELVPNGQPQAMTSNGMPVDGAGDAHTLMGQWSMHDLLTANSLPPQIGFGDPTPGYGNTGTYDSMPGQPGPSTVNWQSGFPFADGAGYAIQGSA